MIFTPRLAEQVEGAIPPQLAAFARGALALDRFLPYPYVDRGRYAVLEAPELPALTDALLALACARTELPLRIVSTRALRFGPGDYALSHHDVRDDEPCIELVADLSERAVTSAAVHYRDDGRPFFVARSSPLSLALVARSPATAANHTYLSKRYADAAVLRLMLRLR